MSRRDDVIVAIRRAIACSWRAWHEVPGKTPPQKSRPVGYGVIRAGVRPFWISCARSYRTLRDGSFEGRFPRHFVPGYDRVVPAGRGILSIAPCLAIVNPSMRGTHTMRAREPSGCVVKRSKQGIDLARRARAPKKSR